jgi:hypothetical protein
MPYFFIRPLEKTLLLSMRAARALGAEAGHSRLLAGRPPQPSTSGSSGATTAKSTAVGGKAHHAVYILGADGHAHGVGGDAAVARQGVYGFDIFILFQRLYNRVLPPAAADDHNVHVCLQKSGAAFTAPRILPPRSRRCPSPVLSF